MEYDVSKDIKIYIESNGLSVKEFANEVGISLSIVSKILNNKLEPNNELLERIYSYFYSNNFNLNKYKFIALSSKSDRLTLVHGSKSKIEGPISNSKSRLHVDFGQGFYAGDNYEQSLDFVPQTKEGSIYVLDVNLDGLKIKKLDVNEEWMFLIAFNRGKLERYSKSKKYRELEKTMNSYDVFIAPIANNRMFNTIDDFINSAISSSQAVHALKALNLGYQYVFKSDKAISQITIMNRLYVSKVEKMEAEKIKIRRIEEAESFVRDAYSQHIREGQYIDEVFK